MKTMTIPVVIGALGVIKKGTEKQIQGSSNLAETNLQAQLIS